jgi:hypothetical protein
MKSIVTILSAGLLFFATSCEKNSTQDVQPTTDNTNALQDRPAALITPRYTQQAVYANNHVYMLRIRPEVVSPYTNHILVNTLYVIKNTVPGSTNLYAPIVNELPTEGFSHTTVWELVYLTFYPSTLPFQLTSARQITEMLAKPDAPLSVYKTGTYYQAMMAPLKDQPAATE